MKFKRKDFFKALALGTISLPFAIRGFGGNANAQDEGGPSALSGERFKWKMVTTWPPKFPVLGEAADLFAKWVKEMSAGRLEIKVFGGGELVGALEAFDAVRSGAAEMGSGASYYWAGKAPASQFFASVPFGMNAQQLNAWILCGGGMELWEELYGSLGLVPLLAGNSGVQMGGWFNREINSMADLQGLKMRIPGLGGKVLKRAGGAPVLLAGGEIYTGLERGVIDATEWIGPYHDYKMGFHQIAKYYYAPGWHETGTALEMFINQGKYNQLPNDLKMIVQTAAQRINIWMLSEFETKNSIYLQKIIDEGEVQLRQFPKEVLEQLREHTRESIAEVTAADPFSKRVYESYSAFQNQISNWSEITEKSFYNNIQLS